MGPRLLGCRAGCCTAAALLRDNGDDHTRAKTELIQELTDKARAERGLPPTGVWEK